MASIRQKNLVLGKNIHTPKIPLTSHALNVLEKPTISQTKNNPTKTEDKLRFFIMKIK